MITRPEFRILRSHNQRFSLGNLKHPNQDKSRRREVLKNGQNPIATVLTCSDSRVPPEIIFDCGIGDLFVIRNAGNVIDDVTLGTIEYGVCHLKTPLLIIMGHQDCGAVKATVLNMELEGALKIIADKISPAVEAAHGEPGDLMLNTIKANIHHVCEEIKSQSPSVKKALDEGSTELLPAFYSLETGEVEYLG